MLVSSTMMGQAYNCGMFGMIEDDFGHVYVGRFDLTMDSVSLESAADCEVFTVPLEVFDIKPGKRWTKIWLDIDHKNFNDASYRIKYPTGSWQIIRDKNNVPTKSSWWPVEPSWEDD